MKIRKTRAKEGKWWFKVFVFFNSYFYILTSIDNIIGIVLYNCTPQIGQVIDFFRPEMIGLWLDDVVTWCINAQNFDCLVNMTKSRSSNFFVCNARLGNVVEKTVFNLSGMVFSKSVGDLLVAEVWRTF